MNDAINFSKNKKTDRSGADLPPIALINVGNQSSNTDATNLSFFPIAGVPLLEYQIRIIREAGIDHIILWTEDYFFGVENKNTSILENKSGFNFSFVSLIDKLRHEGFHLILAHTHQELASAFPPNKRALLMEEGCLPSINLIESLLKTPSPTIVTVEDGTETQNFERIDASKRWGGIALLDGKNLKFIQDIPNDWDLFSTLMRQTVQSGYHDHLAEMAIGFGNRIFKITGTENIDSISRIIAEYTNTQKRDTVFNNKLISFLQKKLLPIFFKDKKFILWLYVSTYFLTAAALPSALFEAQTLALLLLILSGFFEHSYNRINEIQFNSERKKQKKRIYYYRRVLAAFCLLLGCYPISNQIGWGIFPVALLTIFSNITANQEDFYLRYSAQNHKNYCYLYLDCILFILVPFSILSHYSPYFWLSGLCFVSISSILNYWTSSKRFSKIFKNQKIFSL